MTWDEERRRKLEQEALSSVRNAMQSLSDLEETLSSQVLFLRDSLADIRQILTTIRLFPIAGSPTSDTTEKKLQP